ncbi:MAG TPA: hypothetical protein VF618_25140 [Thermoanaerobaculia bacterium]
MGSTDRRTEFLARSIVNRLEDRGLVEFGDAEAVIQTVVRTLDVNFAAAEVIEQEARTRLTRALGSRQPTDIELLEEMRRVAAERKFVL